MKRMLLQSSLALLLLFAHAQAAEVRVIPQGTPAKDPHALAELKQMSDALSSTKSMSFVTTTMTPVRVPNGPWIHVFSTAKVELKRPAHLFIETGGDAFPQSIYFDGNTFSIQARGSQFYTRESMPGTVDQMLAEASEKGGYAFPFADVLLSDPYSTWSQDLNWARYIGESTRGREKLQHFAFAAKNVDWEVWTDQKTHLPRMVFVKYTGAERTPTILIEFKDWKVNPSIADSKFTFHVPAKGKKLPLKSPADLKGATK